MVLINLNFKLKKKKITHSYNYEQIWYFLHTLMSTYLHKLEEIINLKAGS